MNRVFALMTAFRLCFPIFVLALVTILSISSLEKWEVARNSWLVRGFGYAALISFALSFSVTPLNRLLLLFKYKTIPVFMLAFRRALGISAACFALIHAGLVLYLQLEGNWGALIHIPFYRAGLLALIMLLILLTTSYPRVLKLFRIKLWRHLHKLVYIIGFILLQHIWLSTFIPNWVIIMAPCVFLILILLRLLPKKLKGD
jgi:sulfoxide reductase heme-binding subunit YedZ